MLVCETVRLDPGKRQAVEYRLLGDRVSRLWNAANYLCRQSFLAKEGVPTGSALEERMKDAPDYRQLPSDIAQEVLKYLSEAWKSYFALREKWSRDSRLQKPGLPRYRKDKSGERPADWIPVKHSRSYALTLTTASIVLPRDRRRAYGSANGRLNTAYRGRIRYQGSRGRGEFGYDRVRRRWYFSWSVKAPDPNPVVSGLSAAVDLGVRITASLSIEGKASALHFEGREAMKDWDWSGREIAREQSCLSGTRGVAEEKRAPSSRNVSILHAKRRRRVEHALKCMAKDVAETCREHGVSMVYLGHPKDVLRDVRYGNREWAGRIHNFWSFDLSLRLLTGALAKLGIASARVGERGSSSTCPSCGSRDVVRRPRSLLTCKGCEGRIHSDQAGSRNILQENKPSSREGWAGLEASPQTETRRWTRHRWEPRSANPGREVARAATPEFLRAA